MGGNDDVADQEEEDVSKANIFLSGASKLSTGARPLIARRAMKFK